MLWQVLELDENIHDFLEFYAMRYETVAFKKRESKCIIVG